MWLMKCPALVSRSLKIPSSDNDDDDSARPVAKVILSIDPLQSNEDSSSSSSSSSTRFTMELISTESGNAPKRYSMDMSKDLIPMSVFAESSNGKISVEGKIKNKFDMRPHHENMENYGKLCRERTNKYMTKSRQIQVIDNDNGSHMRPMPGMMISTGFTVLWLTSFLCSVELCFALCYFWENPFSVYIQVRLIL
ncbi:hypothetical protein CISIN_1g025926mg [Citrus sinensis]|uniref:Uncharacterized protein n=1 Tax=Citrus sinensis TaxID=2711 RepID=A0A067DZQ4_CITSI|nr:hypothetical protein CISIN_1g025926mg [Citrus sinensis]